MDEKLKEYGKLILIEPKDSSLKKEIILDKEIFRIGRHDDNELFLNLPFISRFHLQIYHDFNSKNTFIMDMNSSNGTFLNEEKIKKCSSLKEDDLISLSTSPTSNDKHTIYKFISNSKKRKREQQIINVEELKEKKIEEKKKELNLDDIDFENIITKIEDEFKCPICQELLIHSTTIVSCSHTFCLDCLKEWFKSNKNCPVCRKRILKKPTNNVIVDKYIESLGNLISDEEIDIRNEKLKESNDKMLKNEKKIESLKKNQLLKSLNVTKSNWSYQQKNFFQENARSFQGSIRLKFCKIVGLDENVISNADRNTLGNILSNIGTHVYLDASNSEKVKSVLKDWIQQDLNWN
eukprot:gene12752-7028_t